MYCPSEQRPDSPPAKRCLWQHPCTSSLKIGHSFRKRRPISPPWSFFSREIQIPEHPEPHNWLRFFFILLVHGFSTYSVMMTIVFIPHFMDPNQEDISIHCMLKAILFHRCVIIYFYFQVQTEEHAVDSGAFRHLVLKHHCCIQHFCGLHCIHVLIYIYIYILNKVLKLEYNIKHQKFKE